MAKKDINHVTVIGRLTRDTELKYTKSGSAVSRLSIASNRSVKNGDNRTEEVSYFDVVLWGKTAENLNQYLTKGKQIAVDGELRQNRWEQDGQKRSKVEIVAMNVQLLGGDNNNSGNNSSNSNNFGTRNQNNGQQQRDNKPPQYQNKPQTGLAPDFDDDIPF